MGRMEGVWRIVALIYLLTIGPIILSITFLAGFIWMVIDVLLTLAKGEGWSPSEDSGAAGFLRRVYYYGLAQVEWTLFGKDEFPIVP